MAIKTGLIGLVFLLLLLLDAPSALGAGFSCEKLSINECLGARGCVLACGRTDGRSCAPYHCRAAADSCEAEYPQKELTRAKCESLPGCRFEEARCFCPPGPLRCYCAGGPPPRCEKK